MRQHTKLNRLNNQEHSIDVCEQEITQENSTSTSTQLKITYSGVYRVEERRCTGHQEIVDGVPL
jgi:hypothetical protein